MNFPFRGWLRGNRTDAHARRPLVEQLEDRQLLSATLLLDINPGPAGSDPGPVVEAGGLLYFTANDGVHGRELWTTDGTPEGTSLVKDIFPGPTGSAPFDLTAFADSLYFFVQHEDGSAAGLWKSDGTDAGTTLVRDLDDGVSNGLPRYLTAAGGYLYFAKRVNWQWDVDLWKSDGTTAGTTLLKSYDSPGAIQYLTAVQGRLFYRATSGHAENKRLWTTEGETVREIKLTTDWGASYPRELVALNGLLYLAAQPRPGEWYVHEVDPVTLDVVVDESLAVGGSPQSLTATTSGLFFLNSLLQGQLYHSNGAAASARLVELPQEVEPNGTTLRGDKGALFFVANEPGMGETLWKSTATEAARVVDLDQWWNPLTPREMLAVGQKLFFVRGRQIWETDGTAAGTRLLATPADQERPIISGMRYARGRLFFSVGWHAGGGEMHSILVFEEPAVTLTSSSPSSGLTDEIELTAQVAGDGRTPHGFVQFLDGGYPIALAELDGQGRATVTVTSSRGGARLLSAVYWGDAAYGPATSQPLAHEVRKAAARVRFDLSAGRVDQGTPVTFVVTVSSMDPSVPWVPRGHVVLRRGDEVVAAGELGVNGRWTGEYVGEVGLHELTAHYEGGENFGGKVSGAVTMEVVRVPAPTAVSLHITYTETGGTIHVGVYSAVGQVTGIVVIKDSDRVLGVLALTDGAAQLSIQGIESRFYRFVGVYEGTEEFQPSTSMVLEEDRRVGVTMEAGKSRLQVREGRAVTVAVRVRTEAPSAFVPEGVVRFFRGKYGNTLIAEVPVVDEQAVLSVMLKPGWHNIRMEYLGDDRFRGRVASWVAQSRVYHETTVDLMVVYTQELETRYGGAHHVRAAAVNAVREANLAFQRSRIDVSVRLVAVERVDYAESGNYDRDLKRLARNGDGHLDKVHAQRNRHGADLVSMFVWAPGAGGVAGAALPLRKLNAPENVGTGFSVVHAMSASQHHTLAHELGHNFGAMHDAANAGDDGEPIFPYAQGFRFVAEGDGYRDIMSYGDEERIPYFSNPRVTYKGVPIGDPATADVARLIGKTARSVAAYRKARVGLGGDLD